MTLSNCHILITVANGFIGKNLVLRLSEFSSVRISTFVRTDNLDLLSELVSKVDAIVHLAGENRPTDPVAFLKVNSELTSSICNRISQKFHATGRYTPLILASSTQAELNNPYGKSKLAAEMAVQALSEDTGNPCTIFRFPGVFGKWCKPNYNSVVATFCHNIAHGLPIQINDPGASLRLIYIDDVVFGILAALEASSSGFVRAPLEPEYTTTLSELANYIHAFHESRSSLIIEAVGTGFIKALYATYVSYLPKKRFSYKVPQHADQRGVFVEVLKTQDSGQFSYFTAYPGITRGGHYHHTKTEKFLVIKGEALFRFRHLLTNELVQLRTNGSVPQVVDSIPGWTHDITNIGEDEMVVMLWANENFDKEKPDTVAREI